MNIIIITQGIPPPVHALLQSRHHVTGIVEDSPRIPPPRLKRSVQAIISTFKPGSPTLSSLCRENGIPYFYLDNNQESLKEWVRSIHPDLIVIYSMSHLLRAEIISIPPYGAINLHPSLLPSYRGPDPIFWMYYTMEERGGITIYYIDEGEDTGDIIFQESFEIPPGSNGQDLQHEMIEKIGVPLLLKAIDAIEKGDAPRIRQPAESPTIRARYILPEEQKGMIDWENWEIQRIWHLLGGCAKCKRLIAPPTGLYTGQRWKIGEYRICDTKNLNKGAVLQKSGRYCVAGRDGIIYLTIEFDIKKTIHHFFNTLIP